MKAKVTKRGVHVPRRMLGEAEIVTFFNSRGKHAKAVEIGQRLLRSASVEIVHVVMEREGIEEAPSFDRHFEQAGFKRLPESGS